jgi:hypothetical protein
MEQIIARFPQTQLGLQAQAPIDFADYRKIPCNQQTGDSLFSFRFNTSLIFPIRISSFALLES